MRLWPERPLLFELYLVVKDEMNIIICAGKSVRTFPINADAIRLDFRLDVRPIFSLIA